MHCDRLPLNAAHLSRMGRSSIRLKHYGWANPAEHYQRYLHYMKSDPQGQYGSLKQYASILDRLPRLTRWLEDDPPAKKRVLVGSPIHQKPPILRFFLQSLGRLEQTAADLDFLFIDDNTDPESGDLLKRFADEHSGGEIRSPAISHGEDSVYLTDDITHHWRQELIEKVAQWKDEIICRARDEGYDCLFLVDSDLLLQAETIEHLMKQAQGIISEIYWTRWQPEIPPLPQVWLRDKYVFYTSEPGEDLSIDRSEPSSLDEPLREALAGQKYKDVERLATERIKNGQRGAIMWQVLGETLARQEYWLTARRVLLPAANLAPHALWASQLKDLCERFPEQGERRFFDKLLEEYPDPQESDPGNKL